MSIFHVLHTLIDHIPEGDGADKSALHAEVDAADPDHVAPAPIEEPAASEAPEASPSDVDPTATETATTES